MLNDDEKTIRVLNHRLMDLSDVNRILMKRLEDMESRRDNSDYVFKLNDNASFGGIKGKVIKICPGFESPILVYFPDIDQKIRFSPNGLLYPYHKIPLLKLI